MITNLDQNCASTVVFGEDKKRSWSVGDSIHSLNRIVFEVDHHLLQLNSIG